MHESDTALDAVTWALAAYLEPQQARAAAALWPRPASGDASSMLVGLSRYCRQVAQQFHLQGLEAELHLRIIRALQGSAGARAQAPHEPALRPVGTTDEAVALAPSAALVQRFLQAVEHAAVQELGPRFSSERWRQGLLKHARRVPPVAMQHASDWLWGRTSVLLGDWPARGPGTRLINAAYVALAEWLGPVKADACFTGVVQEFERSRDPMLTNIRSYL